MVTINRQKIAAMLREKRATNRQMSDRYKDTPAQLRTKVYGNVRINHDGDCITLDPTAPGQYGDSTGDAFPPYAWPGGYTIEYTTADGSTLCAACAREEVIANRGTVHAATYDEGPDQQCDGGCGTVLVSSYGDPDEDDEDAAPEDREVMADRAAELAADEVAGMWVFNG